MTLGDWRFLADWDKEIFGWLPNGLVAERRVRTGPDETDVGLFWLPDSDDPMLVLDRMLLTDNVRLIVCDPAEQFLRSIEVDLLREIAAPTGEFSAAALSAAQRAVGFSWLLLFDGGESDNPYYLLERP